MLEGYRAAMKQLYPDADSMFAQDPDATKITLMVLAIEEIAK